MRKLLIIPMLALALLASLAGPARANPVPVGTGTWLPHTTLTAITTHGGNTFWSLAGKVYEFGFLAGVCNEDTALSRVVSHTLANGLVAFNYNIVEECSGLVNGQQGSWTDYDSNRLVLQDGSAPVSLTSNMVMRGTLVDGRAFTGRLSISLTTDPSTGLPTYNVWELQFIP